MPRKTVGPEITREYIFPSRLRFLMKDGKTSQKELAKVLAVRPQTVSLYITGQSSPNESTLTNIALFFDVSTDYLVGLTDNKKPHLSVSEYTGLTEKAIDAIRKLDSKALNGLNLFLESIANN